MKKFFILSLALLLLAGSVSPIMAMERGRGGVVGFFIGCCFGIRTGAAYNDGKQIHWRDWGPILPYVGFIFSLWNGFDCGSGMTTQQLATQYGAIYY